MKVTLKGKAIPRNKVGDPCFAVGGIPTGSWSDDRVDTFQLQPLLNVFTPDEIVELVNRSLYQLEYQSRAHEKYRAEKSALERPVKDAFKTLFPKGSFAAATDDQLRKCVQHITEHSQGER